MDALAPVVVIVVLAAVVWFVSRPLVRNEAEAADADAQSLLQGLEAAKEAKYHEIRELEMDHRTGKVDAADFREQDRRLRAEAVVILREIDELTGS